MGVLKKKPDPRCAACLRLAIDAIRAANKPPAPGFDLATAPHAFKRHGAFVALMWASGILSDAEFAERIGVPVSEIERPAEVA